jgi:uncharacterized protein (UPF0332 family)
MNDYWSKSLIAARSVRQLLAAQDFGGATNRAYYAMFDAARAALEVVDENLAIAKTHGTIIRRFGQHVVIDGGLDPTLGRAFNSAEDFRIAADYERTILDYTEAREILADMERFLTAVEQFLQSRQSQ